jgi:hypothetical protein
VQTALFGNLPLTKGLKMSIELEAECGEHLHTFVDRMIMTARADADVEGDGLVSGTFNGATINVTPESEPGTTIAAYEDECKRRSEEYRNSPEGIKAKQDQDERSANAAKANEEIDRLITGISMSVADQAAWDEFVARNTDPYGAGVVKFAERWAKLMQVRMSDGAKLEAVAEQASRDADNEGITGFMYGCAVSTLAQTWQHGEELRRWHNLDCQLGTEGDHANETGGVLNPALLSVA